MPESKGRSKPAYTPPRSAKKDPGPNARWFVPVMLGLMLAGLISLPQLPIAQYPARAGADRRATRARTPVLTDAPPRRFP